MSYGREDIIFLTVIPPSSSVNPALKGTVSQLPQVQFYSSLTLFLDKVGLFIHKTDWLKYNDSDVGGNIFLDILKSGILSGMLS